MTMQDTLWWMFDLFIVVCFMLFGMAIADSHDQQVWIGALGGLIVHRILVVIVRGIRNHLYGGRSD